jgi:putative flavoprotein involved in K+ transport
MLKRRHGVELHPRAVAASGSTVAFEDGASLDVDAVLWATGFRPDYSWIDAEVFDEKGGVVHERGVTDADGLYFLGLSWQHTRGSALIGWVKDDAEHLAEQIRSFRPNVAAPAAAPQPVA